MTPATVAYRMLTSAVEPLAPSWLRRRVRAGKEHPQRWPEKLARTPVARPPGRLVWLHGASVGETLSLLPLIHALRAVAPELTLLVTSGTATSAELLAKRLPTGVTHRFAPLDLPGAAARFAGAWRPALAVFVESELWPNLLTAVRRQGAATALVSARLSAASLRGWARAPAGAREVLAAFDLVLAQDDATARALTMLGARDDGRLNLKLAGSAPPVDLARVAVLHEAAGGRAVLLAASTHPGEDEVVLDAFAGLRGRACLVIAPRHPERGAAVAELTRSRSFTVSRQGAGEAFGGGDVHVADALGELGDWFSLAASSLVAGSLLPGPGGHNPVEPARLGAPVTAGLHVANWTGVYAALGDAVTLAVDAPALAAAWTADLDAPKAAQARAARAQARLAAGQDVGITAARLAALAHR